MNANPPKYTVQCGYKEAFHRYRHINLGRPVKKAFVNLSNLDVQSKCKYIDLLSGRIRIFCLCGTTFTSHVCLLDACTECNSN
jgi:hypothetical protein